LPAALHQPGADALGTLRVAIRNAPVVQLFAPDGRYEHEPLAVVTVDGETITAFQAAVAELSAALQPGARSDVADFLDDWADERNATPEAVVALASRFEQLCGLSSWPDHDLLAPCWKPQRRVRRALRRAGGRLPSTARPVRRHLARRRSARPLGVLMHEPLPSGYPDNLAAAKKAIQTARTRAVLAANSELIGLYWQLGRLIVELRDVEGWAPGSSNGSRPICGPSSPR
jgi:hypothetical protein